MRAEHPSPSIGSRVRDWTLWKQPAGLRTYLVAIEVAAVLAAALATTADVAPTTADVRHLGLLLVAVGIHLWVSRRVEESRRDNIAGPHMSTVAAWTLVAVATLPTVFALVVIVWSRAQMYPISRRPLYRHTFSSAGIVLAALAAGAVLRGGWAPPSLLLLVAMVAYFACQAVVVGGVIALSTPSATQADIAGSRRDNLFAALVLCAGALLALATGQFWLAPLLGVPLLCAADWAIRQVETARGDARTDDKTGLLNNRGWNEEADRELARARRTGSSVSVAVLDLDHFKIVNDTWGHPAGDAVLRAVSAVLRDTVRKGDVIGRFGGEEFVLLLPDSDAGAATAVAERVRAGIAAMAVPATDKRGAPVIIDGRTVSIGLSVGAGGLAELDALLRTADAAVYDAKTGGRDQVRVGQGR